MCTGGDGFGNVAGVADTAVGDDADFASGKGFGDVADGRDLRHANTCDDAGGADRTGTNANFNHIRASIRQRHGGFSGGNVAADDDEFRELAAQFAHTIQHAFGMSVRGVHHQHVHACFGEQFDAFFAVATGADGGTNAQAFVAVLAGEGVVARAAQVFDGNKAFQVVFIVNKQHFFDAPLLQQQFDFAGACRFFGGYELVLRRHDIAHEFIVFGIAQVAAGNDADHFAVLNHRQAGKFVFVGTFAHFANGCERRGGERVADDAGLKALHFAHFRCLLRGRHVFMDDGDAAELGESNGEAGFGNSIHRGRKEGDVKPDVAREADG